MFFAFVMLVLLGVLGCVVFYLARRLWHGLVGVFPRLRFAVVMGIAVGLAVLSVLGFANAMLPLPDAVKHVLGALGAYAMGAFLYLLMFTVIADAVLLLLRLLRLPAAKRPRVRGAMAIAVVALTVVTVVGGVIHATQLTHVAYTVPIDSAMDVSDLNIVLVSDLHLGAVGSEARLEDTVDEINRRKPDIVCIAGDLFDTDYAAIRDPEAASEILRGIDATYGVYLCFGNHDAGETAPQMREFVRRSGITLLDDTYTVIDGRLVLAGRLDASPIGGYGECERAELSAVLDGADPTLPVVVMDHNPTHFDTYPDEVDLVLSGHTHQGQIFPANLVTGLLYTVDHGMYRREAGGPTLIVTSGAGTWGMPMRVGTDCEIVSIRLE